MSKTTSTKKTSTATTAKKNSARRVAQSIRESNVPLLGELICWNTKSGDQTIRQIDVVEALRSAELDEKVARDLLPHQSFSRAMKQMSDDRLVFEVNQTSEEIIFQLTKTSIESLSNGQSEMKFNTETFIKLNKETGALTCSDSNIMTMAQKLMDEATERRTTNDISKIVQTLFSRSADLWPVRDQGGVYFVPENHMLFADRVELFITKLGGKLVRWPVPAGVPHAVESVKTTLAEGLSNLIADHRKSIESFTLTTRRETIEAAATKFRETRLKLEAYAHHLQEKHAELLAQIDLGDDDLRNRVCAISTERAAAPASKDGLMFGQSIVSVIRWMGVNGWKFEATKKVMAALNVVVEDATLRTQLSKSSWSKKPAAQLSEEQVKQLNDTLAEVTNPAQEKTAKNAKKSAKPAQEKPAKTSKKKA